MQIFSVVDKYANNVGTKRKCAVLVKLATLFESPSSWLFNNLHATERKSDVMMGRLNRFGIYVTPLIIHNYKSNFPVSLHIIKCVLLLLLIDICTRWNFRHPNAVARADLAFALYVVCCIVWVSDGKWLSVTDTVTISAVAITPPAYIQLTLL